MIINCEKISLLLNKISNKTFDNLYNKLIGIIDTNDTYLDFTIERLFNFATEQYLLTKLYSEGMFEFKYKVWNKC